MLALEEVSLNEGNEIAVYWSLAATFSYTGTSSAWPEKPSKQLHQKVSFWDRSHVI